MAVDPNILDDLARRLSNAIPPGLRSVQEDLEKNLRAALQTGFSRLELVTREEFEVQRAVLARTRARVEELERRVQALERQVLGEPPPDAEASPLEDADPMQPSGD